MESSALWENLLLGVLALWFVFWMKPGIQATLEKSRQAKADWQSLFLPIGFVIIFVIFLIVMVKHG